MHTAARLRHSADLRPRPLKFAWDTMIYARTDPGSREFVTRVRGGPARGHESIARRLQRRCNLQDRVAGPPRKAWPDVETAILSLRRDYGRDFARPGAGTGCGAGGSAGVGSGERGSSGLGKGCSPGRGNGGSSGSMDDIAAARWEATMVVVNCSAVRR